MRDWGWLSNKDERQPRVDEAKHVNILADTTYNIILELSS